MQLTTRIAIDLREFFRGGRFDFLEVGQTQEWVLHNFPDPDGFDPKVHVSDASGHRMTIWRYGNIELHFEGPRLFLIYSDYIADLDGGPSLALDRWIVGDPAQRRLLAVMRALTRERIDFATRTDQLGNLRLELTSGVTLHFHGEHDDDTGDPNDWSLSAFALMCPPGPRRA